MTASIIELHQVTLGYGRTPVLREVEWCVHGGDFWGLVGPNGSGKTTLLRGLLGVLKPHAGGIRSRPPQHATGLVFGYVPQEKELNPVFPLSVFEVVLMGRCKQLGPGRRPGAVDRRIALESLAHVGLETLAGASFQALSGGQKQRVLIARALAAEPHVLVLDEPTSGMDLAAEKHVMALINTLHAQQRLTIILASHNLNLVAQYAQQLALVVQGGLLVGETHGLLSAARLKQMYHIDVAVHEIEGRHFIV